MKIPDFLSTERLSSEGDLMQLLKWLQEPDRLVHDPVVSLIGSTHKWAEVKSEGEDYKNTECMLSSFFVIQTPNLPFIFLIAFFLTKSPNNCMQLSTLFNPCRDTGSQ